jgi:hypothetical protein
VDAQGGCSWGLARPHPFYPPLTLPQPAQHHPTTPRLFILGEARRLLAEAREKATLLPAALDEAFLLLLTAQIAGAEGRWAEALAAYEAATAIHARYGARWYWARWLLDWAEAHAARGEPGGLPGDGHQALRGGGSSQAGSAGSSAGIGGVARRQAGSHSGSLPHTGQRPSSSRQRATRSPQRAINSGQQPGQQVFPTPL